LFPDASPDVEEVSRKVLEVINAAAQEKSEILEASVPDQGYREVFLKIARNLAPTGKTFQTLELKQATDEQAHPVVLTPETRQVVNSTLRVHKKKIATGGGAREQQLCGVLRALHLDKDWIEIALSDDPYDYVQVHRAGDVIDDIVGPLVNHRVVVDVVVQPDGKHLFRDIQSEE
jgi:hypothetical protein